MRLEESHKASGVVSGVYGSGEVSQNVGGKGSSICRKWVIAEALAAVIASGWSLSIQADSQDSGATRQVGYSTAVQDRAGALSGGTAGADAGAAKPAVNDAREPAGQYAQDEEKAYYLDLQVIRVSPEELEQLRKSAEQGTR